MSRRKKVQDDDLLRGWKEIGDYIGKSTKTAQRYAKSRNLPLIKLVSQSSRSPALASKRAINAWKSGGLGHVFLTDTKLIALDQQTRILWDYRFPHPLREFSQDELSWRLRIINLDGTEERGVLVAAQFLSPSIPDTLFYFDAEGTPVWQLEAEPPLCDREGTPFDRAWAYRHIVVAEHEKKPVIWAALANDAGWAGCVLRINGKGSAVVHLANGGFVERLCPASLPEGDFLIACGENNDYDQSFVALLAMDDPPACAPPGERLVYRYANAPVGAPRKYILFPRTELNAARAKPYGHATQINEHIDGIIVEVETGDHGAHFRYHFAKDLEPRYAFPSASHEFAHQGLEKTGAIQHAWLECPEMQSALVLRIWEPDSEWYERTISWRDNPWKDLQSSQSCA